jgi:transaldolase
MNLKQNINFSLWCDFIERDFLQNEFKDILNDNIIHGATSNPAIFEQSINSSDAYTQQINMLQENDAKKIYEELAIADIKSAANIMQELNTSSKDSGFISIEIDPNFCNDANATIEEGKRLFANIAHNNVMIKVPATEAGYIAMKELTSLNINVNATLVFSADQAIKSTDALNKGILKSTKETQAVVSVFVSRFDRLLDKQLKYLDIAPFKTGIINATKCYYEIQKFENKNIRTLFASTGVKEDELEASYYIDNLVYPNSVNTAPLDTIKAYIHNNNFLATDIMNEDVCDEYFDMLKKNGINIDDVSNQLLDDGLKSFVKSFENLLKKLKRNYYE